MHVQCLAARLAPELREQLSQTTMGWSRKGLPFTAFLGPCAVVEILQLAMQQVDRFLVVPAVEWKNGPRVGQGLPISVDGLFDFMVQRGSEKNMDAQFEIMRVVEALVSAGAEGRQTVRGCLLCSEIHCYLGTVCFPNAAFSITVLQLPREDSD